MGLELDFPASSGDCSASWEALQALKYFSLAIFYRILIGSCHSEEKLSKLVHALWLDIVQTFCRIGMVCEPLRSCFLKFWLNYLPIASAWSHGKQLYYCFEGDEKMWSELYLTLFYLSFIPLQRIAVLCHGNLSFQINKFRVACNACCLESSCWATFLSVVCQKEFDVWFFRKHPPSLSNQ